MPIKETIPEGFTTIKELRRWVMTSKERVKAAVHFRSPDKIPLQYYYSPVGYYEHGEKLNDLYAQLPGDFEPFTRQPIPAPDPKDVDDQGHFHSFHTDEWQVIWEKRIYGVTGIPYGRPLEDPEALKDYVPPKAISPDSPGFSGLRDHFARLNQEQYYTLMGCGGIYERLIALCGDENVLCGMALEEEYMEEIADMVADYSRQLVETAIACQVDCVALGDDYGTERDLIMSPSLWRQFIKPRLRYILEPAVKAGIDIHFHSCGHVSSILEDFRELGVTSIWPQLPAYNMEELARRCRELGLAIAIHTDRARTMTYGTPQQVRDLVMREYDTFRMADGGAWFYVEADNDFPFANIEALIRTIAQWR